MLLHFHDTNQVTSVRQEIHKTKVINDKLSAHVVQLSQNQRTVVVELQSVQDQNKQLKRKLIDTHDELRT